MPASLTAWMPELNNVIAILNILIVPVLVWIVKHLRSDMRSGLATEESMQALAEKTQRALRAQAAKVVGVDHAVEMVRLDMKYRPTQDDFNKLKEQVAQLAGEVHATMRQVETIAGGVGRIEEFLLNGTTRT